MLLFFDIETAPECDYASLGENKKKLWVERYYKDSDENEDDFYHERAWLYAEYSKILCISYWRIGENWIEIKSLVGDETKIICDFFILIMKYRLAWFNIKQFDIPFICKRSIILWIKIPSKISPIGKKPWEVDHVDLMEIRKFNGFTSTGLALVCESLGLPSPKDEMSWADVWRYYHKTGDVYKIAEYCEKDVKSCIEVYQKILECVIV